MTMKEIDWITIKDRIKPFEIIPSYIDLWTDLGIWYLHNEDFFSDWLKQKFSELKEIIRKFYDNDILKEENKEKSLNYSYIRKLVYGISKYQNIYDALFFANGWKGLIGLELAKTKLKLFYNKNKRFPTQREMDIISNKVIQKKKYWKKFGINSWNDLLKETFGQVNKTYNIHRGKKGLEKAKYCLLNFQKKQKRLPTARDKMMITYSNVVARGIWSEFGINTWNDLLIYTFKKINKSSNLYKGELGLNRAKIVLKNYYKKYKKKPTSEIKEVASILVAIKRNYWSKFGIKSWNDLLENVFGNVNVRKGIWTGEKGLERAKEKLKSFFIDNNALPTNKTKGFGGIVKAIQRGYWKQQNIHSWNEFIFFAFKKNK